MQGEIESSMMTVSKPSLQSMAELDEISCVQGIKRGVHGVQTLFFRVRQAALGTYIDLIAHNTRVQGLNFGVHVELLQIFLCVQLPRSADWLETSFMLEFFTWVMKDSQVHKSLLRYI